MSYMQKFLITGFSGFVSYHFLIFLEQLDQQSRVLGIDINYPSFSYQSFAHVKCSFERIDLLDKSQVDNIIYQFQPDYVLHLASYSSVAFSWKNPTASFANNTTVFLNLLEQIRELNLKCRVLSVGSSEEYGNISSSEMPLNESHQLNPVSPYAVARVSQELLSKVYVSGYGMDIVLTRSFNHIGPGQKDIFVVSSFVKQMVEIKKHFRSNTLITGDLSIVRDFLDVRDVVRAYHNLLMNGISGEVYNVCSGVGVSLAEIVQKLFDMLELKVDLKQDVALIRPNDNMIIIGDSSKLKLSTGWRPEYTLKQSLEDVVAYWEANV